MEPGIGRTGIKSVWTDTQGKYTLTDLPGTEGTYYVMTVDYSKRGYEKKTLWVGVTAGTTTVQDVTLRKL